MALFDFVDKNSLIKPRKDMTDSGNGVLYTCLVLMFNPPASGYYTLLGAIDSCIQDSVLYRTPERTYGPEAWDDHLVFAAYCLVIGHKLRARQMLANNKKAFWRFPQVWILYLLAAFPSLKPRLFPLAGFIARFMNSTDASGVQLEYTYLFALRRYYSEGWTQYSERWAKALEDKYLERKALYQKLAPTYYDEGHPILWGIDAKT